MTYDGAVERQVLDWMKADAPASGAERGAAAGAGGRGSYRRRRAALGYRAPLGRFLGLSLTTHALILAAGLGGGAAYVRRSGVEQPLANAQILLEVQSQPSVPVAAADAEPEREVEREEPVTDAELAPLAEASSDEAAILPSWELLASAEPLRAPGDSRELEELIGDPRTSWRLPSHEAPGLHVGHVHEPPVSDCCGEPQPAPAVPPKAELYVYPKVVKMAPADFPQKSLRLGEDGSVLLEMTVGTDGLVKDVRIAQSSGYSRIDDCAVAAAWHWIYEPATRNGKPEVALARHRYTFRLTGSGG